MSLQTWKKEFYPHTASSRKALAKPITHALKKWRGLTDENLKRHNIKTTYLGNLRDDENNFFVINSNSCTLCKLYINLHCIGCPLYITRKHYACHYPTRNEDFSPYDSFTVLNNPQPMIKALELALIQFPE